MKENLATRVGRIVSGGASKLVDMLENAAPEMVLEQALKEIDEAVFDIKGDLGKVIARKHMANTRLLELNRIHGELTEKIQFALNEQREDLAEAAISKQLDIEAQLPILESSIGEYGEKEKELERYTAALVARKRELAVELADFRKTAARQNECREEQVASGGSIQSIEGKVSRAESVFERVIDRAASVSPTSMKTESQLAELEELTRKNRIKERLAQFKQKD